MNGPRYRAGGGDLPTVSGSVPRPMGGQRPIINHTKSTSSIPMNYRANYKPHGFRPGLHVRTRQTCQYRGSCARSLMVTLYLVTVGVVAGLLAFWYMSLWVPNLSKIFVNGTYGLEDDEEMFRSPKIIQLE